MSRLSAYVIKINRLTNEQTKIKKERKKERKERRMDEWIKLFFLRGRTGTEEAMISL